MPPGCGNPLGDSRRQSTTGRTRNQIVRKPAPPSALTPFLGGQLGGTVVVGEHLLPFADIVSGQQKDLLAQGYEAGVALAPAVPGVCETSNAMVLYKPFHGKIRTDPCVNVPHGVWDALDVSPLALFKGSWFSGKDRIVRVTCNQTKNAWALRLVASASEITSPLYSVM